MEFKKQSDIDVFIKEKGLFLSDNKLYLKVDDFDWISINDKKDKVTDYITNKINPLSDATVKFPSISLSVFANYEQREEIIARQVLLLDEITKSQKKLFNNKNWRLIELETFYKIENEKIQYLIYDVAAKEYNPIKKSFLKDNEIKAAFKVKNIMVLNKLNTDNLTNKYEESYEIELKRFNDIGVFKQWVMGII